MQIDLSITIPGTSLLVESHVMEWIFDNTFGSTKKLFDSQLVVTDNAAGFTSNTTHFFNEFTLFNNCMSKIMGNESPTALHSFPH